MGHRSHAVPEARWCARANRAAMAERLDGPLEPVLQRKIEVLFPESERAEAARLVLEECANMPFVNFRSTLFYVRAAVLKMSEGRLDELRRAIALRDWRDILVFSGFQSRQRADAWLESEK